MNKNKLFGGILVCALLGGSVVGIENLQKPSLKTELKVHYQADNVDQLANDSQAIIVGTPTTNRKEILYDGVNFIATDVKVVNQIKSDTNLGDTITLLQTVADEDPDIRENGKSLLFLEKYEGPIIKNAYVCKGLYQGQYKVKDNDAVIINDINENNKELANEIRNKNNLIQELKDKYRNK